MIETRPQIDRARSHNRDYFIFGDAASVSRDIYITGVKICDSPARDVSFYSIPGRNGDLVLDNGRWKNLDVTYSCAIATDFDCKFTAFKRDLLNQVGYKKLQDTIHPDSYRMAVVAQPIKVDTVRLNRTGRFDITFNCKPQRYLKYGDQFTTLEKPRTLFNQYGTVALPLIAIYGTSPGTLTVGDTTVEIMELDGNIILDCDSQNAYRMIENSIAENLNSTIYAPEFPKLVPDENEISWTGGIKYVAIKPRWWIL